MQRVPRLLLILAVVLAVVALAIESTVLAVFALIAFAIGMSAA